MLFILFIYCSVTLLVSFSHISTSGSLDLLKLGANRLDIDPGAT